MKRIQPKWEAPSGKDKPKLHLYNSLTRNKEEFVPQSGNKVTWYNCGPTVYDASHMGHARTYMTFDILRRVLMDYFNYDVFYCMNITDVDDKIIVRARQNHLMQKYIESSPRPEVWKADVKAALEALKAKIARETDSDKHKMLTQTQQNVEDLLEKADAGQNVSLLEFKDILSSWLDKQRGSTVTDNKIFADLPLYWEEDYHKDMEALNVLPPDVLTRVSEYIPEIVKYSEKLIANGYAYSSHGSVYFNTKVFNATNDHFYAKMVPEAYGDQRALAEGEGELSVTEDQQTEKHHPTDFAVWKASKPGEPAWDSPWGKGRPGWHIECSVMASDIFGESMDIHSGGVDLKFPHHDNELAQAEAYYENDHWVRYFVHFGHLTVDGCKMSKSLKNFITIKEVLEKYTARQLRLMFLLHAWKETLDYSERTMEMGLEYERTLKEFFLNVKDSVRLIPSSGVGAYTKWGEEEVKLNDKFQEMRKEVHIALCDNIDTRSVMEHLRELMSAGNTYMSAARTSHKQVNRRLLWNVAAYITDILKIFGAIPKEQTIGFPMDDMQGANYEETVMPFVSAFADFRRKIRSHAKATKQTDILMECDKVRDDVLPDLGVRLEDHEGTTTAIKLVGKGHW
ncbi:unnamed protein product [Lymnaea stagnalis]|uniref:Cysteine--tRNA ligase, cytoplasmic n=1 Tax=Lymnaea stagnalis TaxID=6523 RepID=A0AAV2HND4_LYMST